MYTNHQNLESLMTTKELTRQQAQWAEILSCFDFEIVFRPRRQLSKPDALSQRPDLAPPKGEKLTFGQFLKPENITAKTFAEVAEFDAQFVNKLFDSDKAERWFQIDVVGVEPTTQESSETMMDVQLIWRIQELTPEDDRLAKLLASGTDSAQHIQVADGSVYKNGLIESLKAAILRSRHESRLAGHPGRARTMALVRRCFTWPSMRNFVNRYVDGCDLCLRVKPSYQQPLGTLEPLPIPAGPWTDISYDLITNLPPSNGHDCILTVVDRLTKMAHFLPCNKTTGAEELADLMIRNVWKLHGTPKTIVSDRGSIFVSQITQELDQRLGIQLHPLTVYHPQTDGQSKITNKAVEQYLRHFTRYQQDDWESMILTAEFSYNNNLNTSTGVSPFMANYAFNPNFGGVPTPDQCLPSVEQSLDQIKEVQTELKEALSLAQAAMKEQFDKHVRPTPEWKIGDEVWLNSRNILTTRPSPKMDHRWLGPFSVLSKISTSAYKLTLPDSMKGIHPVFHVSVLRKHVPDTIADRQTNTPDPIIVDGMDKWEVEGILDCRKRGRRRDYLVSWKRFGTRENSWEPEGNLENCAKLVQEFNHQYPDAAKRHKRTRRKK
jgi:transposase InsO family protein